MRRNNLAVCKKTMAKISNVCFVAHAYTLIVLHVFLSQQKSMFS